ncbi:MULTISPECIES: hypothetical protein [unclassified Tolypothrix]|uniref:hypothetical protein n=1 Tax=unclassified Tolypothrix TaxID=2649714 RepID=UPI0005EAAB2E|nr:MULTISPECIES: hypothetical protein [unclassified Tolypothrix]BAY90781.1 hypothetical protein NIES3275_27980 [Microchaete diplosiphon NIES-3275]EKF04376.1 hypothetical protein FDUTEX481_02055 [Tolypothrix sp. PCC 7601]MBE9081021.1 hypothetical protein [Tolypothrix sp. LEGE 11397]UYD24913.1 hypothetical protein HGR01_26370 [Tolypothrix sp. PCC 7712]UYD32854.1 hypothetical protein HG267_28265 [Tolypothrix sp. PCC 7601]
MDTKQYGTTKGIPNRTVIETCKELFGEVPKGELTSDQIAALDAKLACKPNLPALPDAGDKLANSPGIKAEIDYKGLPESKFNQLVEAFISQGVSEAEALIHLRDDAFIRTLQNADLNLADGVINQTIARIIRNKAIASKSQNIINARIPEVQSQDISEMIAAAKSEVNGSQPWRAFLPEANDSQPWKAFLED